MEPMFTERMTEVLSNKSQSSQHKLASKPVMQALAEQFGGYAKANEVIKSTMLPQLKSLGTVDISALRLVSLSDRVAVRRNDETKFLNWLESKGDFPSITDYQFRIKERDIVTDTASKFNIDGALPANVQSAYNQRYNTLTTVGDTLKISFMLSSIAEQQSDVNVLQDQIDDEIVRIRRTMSNMLLSNTEQISEVVGNVPQLGGFITRSTLNSVNAGGSNLTNTLIQNAVNTIALQLGYGGHQFLLWTTVGQLPVVRDLMINRFPGENSATWMQSLGQNFRNQLVNYSVATEVAYVAYPGGVIPCVYDTQMPANSALIFCGEIPRMARFKMDGQTGPFVLARPEPTLYELLCVFDIFTLDDPLQVSRVSITNLAS